MNNRFLGNASCLTKYDALIKTALHFEFPIWYVSMVTEPLTRNKGDRNATNFRLGSQNEELLELMKSNFYGDDTAVSDISELFKSQGIVSKVTAGRNNTKAGHFRTGYINYFNHKERAAYFELLTPLIDSTVNQIIFLDPDTGVMPSCKKLPTGKGSSFIKSSEVKQVLEMISADSVVMVQQQVTNYQYTHEDRVKELVADLGQNVIMLVDEVIQSGIYIIAKNETHHQQLITFMWEYLVKYQFVKSNERVMLIAGNAEGVTIKTLGIPKAKPLPANTLDTEENP
ncbi:hypothetical protein CJD36_011100 [Flavipsychrobacter stenotrophus]|uniref:Uncharacterized protein n=1 Tax=Flavipsychrobacter stenotrophus TaxID=2077091 RepID=A0A2S7SV81_9BACT|nr:hypothetical protein [Flavipsychrobacter stenotrophus]PQJ10515.1 hypothetical protein CJD36_011100 [Flavipsychrobacter stenotrophus]